MEIRRAGFEDIGTLARLRHAQLIDEGDEPCDIDAEMRGWFEAHMADGSSFSLLAEEDGEAVATCGVATFSFPPSFKYQTGRYGYIHSVYTAKEWRGKGIAKALLAEAVKQAEADGLTRMFLHASPEGKPVYEKLGFEVDTRFMGNF